jgi:hypothetical protein
MNTLTEEELEDAEDQERHDKYPMPGHPTGLGEYTLRSARWINGPATMREEGTTRNFMTERARYEGGESEW